MFTIEEPGENVHVDADPLPQTAFYTLGILLDYRNRSDGEYAYASFFLSLWREIERICVWAVVGCWKIFCARHVLFF